ncbi:MAG: ferritin family protein [Proteobacteria bacterium]|nr:ferritin family protein [Pseudomonadota bacterium]
MDHTDFLKNSLREAIIFEQNGREFFLKSAEEAKNPFAKEIFKTLADEELKHIKRIKEVFDNLVRENVLPTNIPASENKPWKNIFKEALERFRELVKSDIQDKEAIKLGLDFESKGFKFYDQLAKKSTDPVEKRFFEILRDEEEGHYLLIENLEKFLLNPVDWFGEQEHHIFEG